MKSGNRQLGLLIFVVTIFISSIGFAQKNPHSLGFNLSFTNSTQGDINSWISSVNLAGTKELGSAYEFIFDYQYRFKSSMFAVLFRPSYFMQSAEGAGVKASLTGMTLFPMFRFYPLENKFIQFFMQVGLGYGSLSATLENSNVSASGSYSSSSFGALGGLGANFCFTPNHCMVVEGNFRYLPFERMTGSGSGSLGGNVTQTTGELEQNSEDLGATMSGVQGLIGYRLIF